METPAQNTTSEAANAQAKPRALSVELFHPDTHYAAIQEWWKKQNWPILPLTHLSQTGLVVKVGDVPAAAAWLYKSDSAFCWLEWVVANPEVRHAERDSALSVLISTGRVLAQTMGFQSIYMSVGSASLAHRIEAHGFAATDKGVTNFMCDLTRR